MGALDFLFAGKPAPNVTTSGSSATSIPQWLSDYTHQLIGKANAVGSMPYAPYTGPRIAKQTDDQNRAQQMLRENAGSYTPAMRAALTNTQNVPGEEQGAFDAAAGTTMGAVAPGRGGLNTAMPWLQGASGSFTGDTVGQYMNPYTQNVIDRATFGANRNFRENLMPQLSDTFTSNGQFGSSAHEREAYRGARDLTEGLQANAFGEYGRAYDAGRGAYQTDAQRYLDTGRTAGTLEQGDQGTELRAGQQIADIGNQHGRLALDSAQQAGALTQNMQGVDLRDTAALTASGADQQAQTQRSLDQAHQDFTDQRDYGKNQLNWENSILNGLPYNQQSASTTTGPGSAYQPSLASQLGSLYSIYKGVTTPAHGARGGLMRSYPRRYARGGLVVLEA